MSSDNDLSAFPDVKAKLQKPTKQSAFEKQKAEAEAKRQREAAETAAVYKDFLKSFDRDDDGDSDDDGDNGRQHRGGFGGRGDAPPRPRPGLGGGVPSGPGASKRHFGASGLKSGPGSLGPPPMSFGKKRSFQDFSRGPPRDAHDDRNHGSSLSVPKAFHTSDDEDMDATVDRAEEKAIAKPTLRLSNLPPGTSQSVVKALIPDNLTVENVKVQPASGPSGSERKSAVAIVTLSQETPGNDIEAAVSSLQNRYLGYGYYLSLHRHLSSAVTGAAVLGQLGSSNAASHPFGAKPVVQPSDPNDRRSQQGFHRGFAPPTSYNQQMGGVSRGGLLHVPVKPPSDIKTIQLINMVIERVLEHGPEFEALLMSRPEVQREEKWAWIWDARGEGGIWYRWRLWEVITGAQDGRSKGRFVPLFDGSHAWKTPDKSLPFEYTTRLDEFVSDSDYNSSDDEDLDGEANGEGQANDEKMFLNPLEKAKLTHLLARLPSSISRLRKGDIARVSTFAIMHASRGVEEVVDLIVSNVEKPFSLTAANPERKQQQEGKEPRQASVTEEALTGDGPDVSASSLVGLYVVSDILSSSSTSGVRHAWRFRQLFEGALRGRKVFERLGMMAEKLGWGRLRAEKWKRSVSLVLNLWESWCVFPAESQELFVRSFENPPSLKVEAKEEEGLHKKGKWKKAVEAAEKTTLPSKGAEKLPESSASVGQDDVDGEPIDEEDVVGEPIEEDDVVGEPIEEDDVVGEPIEEDDVAGEPIEEDDVEGEPIEEDDVAGEPIEEDDVEGEPIPEEDIRAESIKADTVSDDRAPRWSETADQEKGEKGDAGSGRREPPKAGPRKPRMRAVDMFADSDGSDGG
ncbi:U2 snRNP-associated SURP motif-containing protein-like protein [Hapsidospora chrysogenum ATCC 11550]|uniref:U2 snRNP-associated SURP motif-containing protein-like protein n=1 Tax=Hapsidospora chrysogenum (strain ATCC 11550 / CBS 779.69 / DSM 880 / IAM 14645 / JCM 23072 / IMI 49137) TaxID=857340 RepID=A0A086TAI9_HAPC1|nr:U2 snRNP-associated SURP motif-containing protein-like protein [Hapsidospora chrysogenum ATCC 11550]